MKKKYDREDGCVCVCQMNIYRGSRRIYQLFTVFFQEEPQKSQERAEGQLHRT